MTISKAIFSILLSFIHNIIKSQSDLKQIEAVINIDKLIVIPDINICLPIAMIINEWITNTAKYAESDSDTIFIYINAFMNKELITLTYHDSGINESYKNNPFKEGLGTTIINLLCKQINAELLTNNDNINFNYKIAFTI